LFTAAYINFPRFYRPLQYLLVEENGRGGGNCSAKVRALDYPLEEIM
jgi:hypothetical protein